MKDQVPVMLLNKWLEVKPKKSKFKVKKNEESNLSSASYISDVHDDTIQAIVDKSLGIVQQNLEEKNFIKDIKILPKVMENLSNIFGDPK